MGLRWLLPKSAMIWKWCRMHAGMTDAKICWKPKILFVTGLGNGNFCLKFGTLHVLHNWKWVLEGSICKWLWLLVNCATNFLYSYKDIIEHPIHITPQPQPKKQQKQHQQQLIPTFRGAATITRVAFKSLWVDTTHHFNTTRPTWCPKAFIGLARNHDDKAAPHNDDPISGSHGKLHFTI